MIEARIEHGFPEAARATVARLFWEAFSGKLGRLMAPEDKALAFLARTLRAEFALTARSPDGAVLGVAGLKSARGGLVTAGFADLRAIYGWGGAAWRGPLLDLAERTPVPGQLLMDGLFVAEAARGHGIGTRLIEAVVAEAAAQGMAAVRLDVVRANPRARALYTRRGFRTAGERRFGAARLVFGGAGTTTMIRSVPA